MISVSVLFFFTKVIKMLKSDIDFSLFQVFGKKYVHKRICTYTDFTKMFWLKLFSILSTFTKLYEKENFTSLS